MLNVPNLSALENSSILENLALLNLSILDLVILAIILLVLCFWLVSKLSEASLKKTLQNVYPEGGSNSQSQD